MNQVQKLRKIVGPVAQRVHENPPYQSSGSFRSLAELLWEWYQGYEKQLATNELVEKSMRKKSPNKKMEGGDNNE
jgi:hypothetical protein